MNPQNEQNSDRRNFNYTGFQSYPSTSGQTFENMDIIGWANPNLSIEPYDPLKDIEMLCDDNAPYGFNDDIAIDDLEKFAAAEERRENLRRHLQLDVIYRLEASRPIYEHPDFALVNNLLNNHNDEEMDIQDLYKSVPKQFKEKYENDLDAYKAFVDYIHDTRFNHLDKEFREAIGNIVEKSGEDKNEALKLLEACRPGNDCTAKVKTESFDNVEQEVESQRIENNEPNEVFIDLSGDTDEEEDNEENVFNSPIEEEEEINEDEQPTSTSESDDDVIFEEFIPANNGIAVITLD